MADPNDTPPPQWLLALAELGKRIQTLQESVESEAKDIIAKVEEAVQDFRVNIGWEPAPGDEPNDQGPPAPPPPDDGDGGGAAP